LRIRDRRVKRRSISFLSANSSNGFERGTPSLDRFLASSGFFAALRRRNGPLVKPAALVLVSLALLEAGVSAAPPDAQTAEALFQSGKEAMARGDLASACARFGESVRLDPAAGGFLNWAECEERAGKLATALAHFQAARDRLRPDDYRVPFAVDRIARLGPRVPRLTVVVNGSVGDTTVLRDETPLGAASLGVALPVDPGVHLLLLRAPGRADARREVTLREGESQTIDLVPGPVVATPTASSPRAASEETPAPKGGTQRTIGITLGAAGALGIAAGTVLGLVSKSTYDEARSHCPAGPGSCTSDGVSGGESAYSQANAATVAFVAGGALFTAGVTLFLTAPRAVTVAPSAGTHQAGLNVVGRW
jgi:hypothetical protein